jgi:hypothetical protein
MRKATNGRVYRHQPISILKGTAIIRQLGSPRRAAIRGTNPVKMIGNQYTAYVEFIEFEHKPVSGKKSRENFEKSLLAHNKKVDAALKKYPRSIRLDKIVKTSRIVKPV